MSIGRLGPGTELYKAGDSGHPLRTAFITQNVDGHLLTGLTTRQSIVYASRLKRVVAKKKKDTQSSADDHASVAERLATEMALSSVLDVRVECLSGGERKRVSSLREFDRISKISPFFQVALALELSASIMPELVVLDEVTSGLDSTAAEMVITADLEIIQSGMTG